MGNHDDSSHQGSAKRLGNGGVAPLDATGDIYTTSPQLLLTRDVSSDVFVRERTSDEIILQVRRTAANTFTLYNNDIAGGKIIQDSSMKNVASGIAGLDAQLLVGSAGILAFNLLKIASANIMNITAAGGTVTFDNAAGTLKLDTPAPGDDVRCEEKDTIALSLLPRVSIFRVNAFTVSGAVSIMGFGFSTGAGFPNNHRVAVITNNGGANWYFETYGGVATTQTAIATPVAGDVYVIYATSARCMLWRNGAHVVTHTTNIPTAAVGRAVDVTNPAPAGGGNTITIGFMS